MKDFVSVTPSLDPLVGYPYFPSVGVGISAEGCSDGARHCYSLPLCGCTQR